MTAAPLAFERQPPSLSALKKLLLHRRHFAAHGRSDTWLRLACARGELFRVARGWYVRHGDWIGLTARNRHLLHVLAVEGSSLRQPLYAHGTAAILLGLPLLHFAVPEVHTLVEPRRSTNNSGVVIRHSGKLLSPEQRTEGVRHTGLPQTVVDVARTHSFEHGIAVADAAMRRLTRRLDGCPEKARAVLTAAVNASPHSPGCVRARHVVRFASPLSESPLESLTRLQLERLGFTVRQQVPVLDPNGRNYRVDFELEGYGMFFEADGKQKYLDRDMRDGRSLEGFLLDEKIREDRIRGITKKGMVRGGWTDASDVEAMARRLRAFGIEPPRPPNAPPLPHLL